MDKGDLKMDQFSFYKFKCTRKTGTFKSLQSALFIFWINMKCLVRKEFSWRHFKES